LTTLAVFAPVVFIGGFAAVFFGELALVVTFALACSLVVALTVVPMLAGRWLRDTQSASQGRVAGWLSRFQQRLETGYGRLINSALDAPGAIVVASVALLACSVAFVPRVGAELMPESHEGRIDISLELPVGTPLEVTTSVVQDIEQSIKAVLEPGELEHIISNAGPESWWRPGGGNEGKLELSLVPGTERERGVDQILASFQPVANSIRVAKLDPAKASEH